MWSSNKSWTQNITESQFRNIILIGVLLFIVAIIIFRKNIVKNFNWYEQNKEWMKGDYEKEYYGTVVRKGRDQSNHNWVYFQFQDSTKIFDNEEKVWNKVSIGDSVAKKKNSKILLIIKKSKTITVSYDDIYKYRDSLIQTGHY